MHVNEYAKLQICQQNTIRVIHKSFKATTALCEETEMLNCYYVNIFKYGISRYIKIDKHEIHCKKYQMNRLLKCFTRKKKSVFLQNVMLNEMIFLLTNDKFTSIFRVRIVSWDYLCFRVHLCANLSNGFRRL